MEQYKCVGHGSNMFFFLTPNALCHFRAESFSTKEPETLEWIEGFEEDSVMWDIGANIGLYSIYAAKTRKCKVFAFEPSIFNLECLGRNIYANNVAVDVCIAPFALSETSRPNMLNMTTTEWGGALSTFGEEYGFDGKKLNQAFRYQTIGSSMDDAAYMHGIPRPDYIKIDVDGIEHLILRGGVRVLSEVKGVLIEVNDNFQEQASACTTILEHAGLKLKEKRHSEMIDKSPTVCSVYNQVWSRE